MSSKNLPNNKLVSVDMHIIIIIIIIIILITNIEYDDCYSNMHVNGE